MMFLRFADSNMGALPPAAALFRLDALVYTSVKVLHIMTLQCASFGVEMIG